MKMRSFLKNCLWLISFLFLLSCDSGEQRQYRIIHAKVGTHNLYIPDLYMRTAFSSVGKESGYIHAWYPGSAPILRDPKQLWKEGEWYKNIGILFYDKSEYSKRDLEIVLKGQIDIFKAYKVVGDQHGLIYQTQPDDIKNDKNEVWIERENGILKSFITCGKKFAEGIIPQCIHFSEDENFLYHISYDKRLLPEWTLIRTNALTLMNSFKTEIDAKNFVMIQIQNSSEEMRR